MAKPTKSDSLDRARRIKSTIVPLEDKPLRRPYINRTSAPSTAVQTLPPNERLADIGKQGALAEAVTAELSSSAESEKASPAIGSGGLSSRSEAVAVSVAKDAPIEEAIQSPKLVAPKPSKAAPDSKAVNRLIRSQIRQWRPKAWEDDISRNNLDNAPFENLVAPADLDLDEFDLCEEFNDYVMSMMNEGTLIERIARDVYPMPSAPDREGYSRGFDGVYWMSGLVDYLKVMEVAKRCRVQPTSFLDFGCASGRVLRHYAVQSGADRVWGSDINARHVRWLQEFMPMHVRPIFNHSLPTLPIADGSIDVISAFSVFTHIDTFETSWLAELNRVLVDGGICYLTVHNEDTWQVLRDEIENEENRLVQSIKKIDPAFEDQIHGPLPDQRTVYRFTDFGPYRSQVFHSNEYLRQVWGRFFEVREIIPCHHIRQSVVILQK